MRRVPIALCMTNRLLMDCLCLMLVAEHYKVYKIAPDLVPARIRADARFVLILDKSDSRGFDAAFVQDMKQRFPQSQIVLLLETCSQEQRWQAAQLGVAGVLLKTISSEVLVASLKLVALGEHVFSVPNIADHPGSLMVTSDDPLGLGAVSPVPAARADLVELKPDVSPRMPGEAAADKLSRRGDLSEREKEILGCLMAGHSNKVIARRCQITEATVKVHLKAILRKTEVANRTQAAVWATKHLTSITTYVTAAASSALAGGLPV